MTTTTTKATNINGLVKDARTEGTVAANGILSVRCNRLLGKITARNDLRLIDRLNAVFPFIHIIDIRYHCCGNLLLSL